MNLLPRVTNVDYDVEETGRRPVDEASPQFHSAGYGPLTGMAFSQFACLFLPSGEAAGEIRNRGETCLFEFLRRLF